MMDLDFMTYLCGHSNQENISDEVIHRVTKLSLDKIAELREREMSPS